MFNLMPSNSYGSIFKHLDEMEKEFFGDLGSTASSFRTDIQEEDQHYVLKADLPGFKKEDIKLEIQNNVLQISAEHSEEHEEKTEHYIRRERRSGSFRRSFDISNIDTNGIEAAYTDGVLELHLPKLAIITPEVQKIEVK